VDQHLKCDVGALCFEDSSMFHGGFSIDSNILLVERKFRLRLDPGRGRWSCSYRGGDTPKDPSHEHLKWINLMDGAWAISESLTSPVRRMGKF